MGAWAAAVYMAAVGHFAIVEGQTPDECERTQQWILKVIRAAPTVCVFIDAEKLAKMKALPGTWVMIGPTKPVKIVKKRKRKRRRKKR